MRRWTAALLAGFALAAPAPPALAHGDSRSHGECALTAVAATGDTYEGAVDATVAVWSGRHGNAAAATVTCPLHVNGVPRGDVASASGAGVVVVAGRATFTAAPTDVVHLCTVVDYTSDETPTEERCFTPDVWTFPPRVPIVTDAAEYAQGRVWGAVDPVVCARLAGLAPGAGPVAVDASGDAAVAGQPLWDCPPYDGGPYPAESPVPTGGGANDGHAGFLALGTPGADPAGPVAAMCAFADGGRVVGYAVGPGADSTTIRCRLTDAAGAVVYDGGATAAGVVATVGEALAAHGGGLTVCVAATARWGAREEGTGLHCRAGTAT